MIISKASLQAVALSKRDSVIPQLDNIRVERDGTTVSASRNITLAISPVVKEAKKNLPLTETESCSASIPSDIANKVIQAIGTDTAFGGRLEYADLQNNDGKLEFIIKDSRNKTMVISGDEPSGDWIPWRDIIKHNAKTTGKFILNRQRLQMLLGVLDRVIPAKGSETPVYLEFTSDNNVIIRGKNYVTGQHVYGVMLSYSGEDLPETEWEQTIRYPKTSSPAKRTLRIKPAKRTRRAK